MEELRHSLETAPVIDRGDYHYFVHPVSDGIPLVEASLLREIADGVAASVDLSEIDKILTAEAMGIHIATAVSLATDIPFVIARKRQYGFESEVAVHQETGYAENELYVNGIDDADNLLLLDDVISTGNTLAALCEATQHIGATIDEIVVVINRADEAAITPLPRPVTYLIAVSVTDGAVEITDEQGTIPTTPSQ